MYSQVSQREMDRARTAKSKEVRVITEMYKEIKKERQKDKSRRGSSLVDSIMEGGLEYTN